MIWMGELEQLDINNVLVASYGPYSIANSPNEFQGLRTKPR